MEIIQFMIKKVLKIGLTFVPSFKFSAELERIRIASGKLRNIIQKEHKYEHMNYQREDQIDLCLSELNYKQFDDPNSNFVELTKQFSSANVTIIFAGTPPLPDQTQEKEIDEQTQDQLSLIEQQQQKEQDEKKTVEKQEYSVDFTVLISSSSGETIVYECNTADSQVNINFVSFAYDMESYRKRSKVDKFLRDYTGPVFSTLDERVQTGLKDYLQSFGIDQRMAGIIEATSLDKEQRSYMNLLKQLERFLE